MTRTTADLLIDCDVHCPVPSFDLLRPYLAAHWQELMGQSDFKGPAADLYRPELATNIGPRAGSTGPAPALTVEPVTPAALRTDLFDGLGIERAILQCAYAAESLHNPYGTAALVSAVNDWLVAEWLAPEPRLRGALVVPAHEPDLAAQEVARCGDRPEFVQIYLPVRSRDLYGTRRYHPLYRAAATCGLVIGIHAGGAPGAPPTPSGWPSYQVEEYVDLAAIFQSQLISLLIEGVFEEFPTLNFVFISSGFTWLPAFMWRLDKEWKGLRREIPWVKQPPSDYIRQRVRFTLQPLDLPPTPQQLAQVMDQTGADDLLLFSTDYPYSRPASPDAAVPAGLPDPLRESILYRNAAAFYDVNR